MSEQKNTRACMRCSRKIDVKELYKIVMYVVNERLTEHHYEHVECPDRWSI